MQGDYEAAGHNGAELLVSYVNAPQNGALGRGLARALLANTEGRDRPFAGWLLDGET